MSCPPHFSFSTDTCLPTCPAEVYSHSEYTIVITTHTVFSVLAILSSLLVFPPYIAKRSLRAWPGPALMGIFFSVFIIGVSGLFPMIAYGKNNWTRLSCGSETQVADLHHTLCGFSAILYYFFAKFAASLWMIVTLWLLMRVARIALTENLTRISQILSFAYALIMPIIGSSIIIGKNLVEGQTINGGGCFISTTIADGWYYEGLWTIPLMVEFTVGTGALIACFVIIFRAGSWSTAKAFLNTQMRLIPFSSVYWYAVLTINILRFYIIHNTKYFTDSTIKWYGCNAMTWQGALMQNATIEEANYLAKSTCGSPAVPLFGIILWISLSVKIAATLFPLIFVDIKWWMALTRGEIQRETMTSTSSVSNL